MSSFISLKSSKLRDQNIAQNRKKQCFDLSATVTGWWQGRKVNAGF
jgi:hypothetical protein